MASLIKRVKELEARSLHRDPPTAWIATEQDDGTFKATHAKHDPVILHGEEELQQFTEAQDQAGPLNHISTIIVRFAKGPRPVEL